jgi:hypothetical protein
MPQLIRTRDAEEPGPATPISVAVALQQLVLAQYRCASSAMLENTAMNHRELTRLSNTIGVVIMPSLGMSRH